MRSLEAVLVALSATAAILGAAPPQKPAGPPPVEASVGYDAEARIPRGAGGEVLLKAIPVLGYEVPFKIARQPRQGTLGEPRRLSKGSVAIPYRHGGSHNGDDSFTFRFQTGPGKAWATRTARIEIVEPEPRLRVSPDAIDFGMTFAGSSVMRTLRVRNVGGGILSGRLRAPYPWHIDGPVEFQIPAGGLRDVKIHFTPPGAGVFQDALLLESGTASPSTVGLTGAGASRIEIPAELSLAHLEAGDEGALVVRNLTPEPMALAIDAKPPLECPPTLEIAGNASASLPVRLAKRHFAEKAIPLVLTDAHGEFVVKVVLPPSPAVIEWNDASPLDLGLVTAGRAWRREFVLSNKGSLPATGVRLIPDGLSLAADQPREDISIPPGGSVTVAAEWKPVEGDAEASLTATQGGLSQTIVVRARAEVASAAATPDPAPSPQSSPTPRIRVLTPEEREALRRNNASGITYRNEILGGRVQTLIQWTCAATDKPRFQVEQWTSSVVTANPFQTRVQVPGEGESIEPRWQPIGAEPVLSTANGHWTTRIEGLKSGYHKFRIATVRDTRTHYAEFSVHVPPSPARGIPWWTTALLLVLCAWILLRHRLAR